MSPKPRDAERTKAAIIEAARRLFAEPLAFRPKATPERVSQAGKVEKPAHNHHPA